MGNRLPSITAAQLQIRPPPRHDIPRLCNIGRSRNRNGGVGGNFSDGDVMQCPECKRYRHDGPCEPYMSDMEEYEMDHDLEMLQIDAERAAERYQAALAKHKAEGKQHDQSI